MTTQRLQPVPQLGSILTSGFRSPRFPIGDVRHVIHRDRHCRDHLRRKSRMAIGFCRATAHFFARSRQVFMSRGQMIMVSPNLQTERLEFGSGISLTAFLSYCQLFPARADRTWRNGPWEPLRLERSTPEVSNDEWLTRNCSFAGNQEHF